MTQLSENAMRVLDALGIRTIYEKMATQRTEFDELCKALGSSESARMRPPFMQLLAAFEKLAEHATRVMSEPGPPTVEQIAALNKAVTYLEDATNIIEEDGGDEDDVTDAREVASEARAVLSQWTPSAPAASPPESAHPVR